MAPGTSQTISGEPNGVVALGPGKAEMTTSTGAIYYTENAGRNWKALVKETIDATLNRISSSGVTGASYFTGSVASLKRDQDGAYLSVRSLPPSFVGAIVFVFFVSTYLSRCRQFTSVK